MTNQNKIAELKKELESYSKPKEISHEAKEKQEIKDLKKQIREKKYAKIKQTGRNLKIIGKNIGVISKNIGSGLNKALIQDPNKAKSPTKRMKTFDEIMKDLPQ